MNRIQTIRLVLLFVAFHLCAYLPAQSPFFSEDFSSGIPLDWATMNLNGNPIAKWTWCTQHIPTNPPIGCPVVFNDIINRQTVFKASTASNGFAVFDSDYFYSLNILTHNSYLSTPAINCGNQAQVWLKFENHIGVVNRPSKDHVVVEVSTDKVDWTTFNFTDLIPLIEADPNPGIAGWSLNPKVAVIDISQVAALEEEVYIRWRWDGESEYYWALDDIGLYNSDPSSLFIPQYDLRIPLFFAVAPNAMTPISQVERFGFLADIKNDGLVDQSDADLELQIVYTSDNSEVYSEKTVVAELPKDFLTQNILFPGQGFLPEAIGHYDAAYTVNSNFTDQLPQNNIQTFNFEITTNTFAKEDGILSYTTPEGVWSSPTDRSWGWGNYFYCPNGFGYKATSISFSIQSSLADSFVNIRLYQWRDINADGDCQPEERFNMGGGVYTITGFEQKGKFITVPLNDGKGIALDNDAEYIAMVEFEGGDILKMAYNNNFNYGGQYLRSQEINNTRHGSFFWAEHPDSVFIPYAFGYSVMPCIRLNIDLDNALTPQLSTQSNLLRLSPNPVNALLQVQVLLEEKTEKAKLCLLRADGKVLKEILQNDLQEQTFSIDTRHLANGLYFLQLQTEKGVLTERFVVQR